MDWLAQGGLKPSEYGNMTILKFSFTVIGETREEALEEIDSQVRGIMEGITGEPWVKIADDVRRMPVSTDLLNPKAYVYMANQELVFAGPTIMGDSPWGDGFRPQGKDNFPFS